MSCLFNNPTKIYINQRLQQKNTTRFHRYSSAGMEITELSRLNIHEFFITIEVPETLSPPEVSEMIREFLHAHDDARIIKADLFTESSEWFRDFRNLFPDLPLACILARPCRQGIVAGIHLQAASGIAIRSVTADGNPVGTITEDEQMKCLYQSDIRPEDTTISKMEQARRTFLKVAELLDSENMSFSNVVRTWLYLDDILSWYPDFNRVRSEFFETNHVFDSLVPASTGISGKNPAGSAIVAGVYAITSKDQSVKIKGIPSPLQCPALQYGSSFSRAIELTTPDFRQLIISGTASIDIGGDSMHRGDVSLQIDQTMKVIQTILRSRNMNWDNISRSIVYLRNTSDYIHFDSYTSEKGIPHFPSFVVQADICRDELLFEIEVDAISTITGMGDVS